MPLIAMPDLKAYLGITDTTDDIRLTTAAAAASRAVVDHCGRTFDKDVTPTVRRFYAHGGTYGGTPFGTTISGEYIDIPDLYDATGLAVAVDFSDTGVYATGWVLETDYFLEPIDGVVGGVAFPYNRITMTLGRYVPVWGRRPPVQVTSSHWGWATVPDPVMLAALIKGSRLFKRKDSPEGVLSGFGDFGAIRISSKSDPDVIELLYPYRNSTALLGA
jgi:hypothetical protein